MVPQVELRTRLDLYAGIRPARLLPGVPSPLAGHEPGAIDLVVVRESTEGLFASRSGGIVLHDAVATDTQVITRAGTERVVRAAFDWCRQRTPVDPGRPRRVTCVDKANLFRSFAFFRRIFDEIAAGYPDIAADHVYIDAAAMYLVRRPQAFDILVAENMFGDILSDLTAGLVGGLGMAPSADLGDRYAVFQPCHGTAPDIAGQGIANPIATILSAAMLLEWLAERPTTNDQRPTSDPSDPSDPTDPPDAADHGAPLRRAARRIEAAVTAALVAGEAQTPDIGGARRTAEAGDAICRRIAV
jgi:3-isopropylmalate dehydrogenase